MTVDQIIALAASLGACLAAVATFLTVFQMSMQRKATYRPELAIAQVVIESSVKTDSVRSLESFMHWADAGDARRTSPDSPLPTSLPIKLTNIGLGAAKHVTVQWSFPFDAVIEEINAACRELDLTEALKFTNERLTSTIVGTTSFWHNQKQDKLDYVLPASFEGEPAHLRLPDAYVLTVATAMFVYFRPDSKMVSKLEKLPPLTVTLDFEDIGGDKYHAAYDIAFELIGAQPKGGFAAILEPTKHNQHAR